MVFSRLGKRVKNLLGREHDLELVVRERRRAHQAFRLQEGELFLHLRAASQALERARSLARAERFGQAAEALVGHFRERDRPAFFLQPSARDKLRQLAAEQPASFRSCVTLAEQALGHTFAPLGIEPYTFGSSIDWFSDFQGSSWVYGHVEDLRLQLHRPVAASQETLGPVEVTWEFNRHGHFVDMGRAYWLTGREPLASEFVVQAVDWFERNPALTGINWVDPGTIAVRAVNWLLATHLFVGSPQFGGGAFCRVLQAILVHATVLADRLLQGEERAELACAGALLTIALSLPEFLESPDWVDLAVAHLRPGTSRVLGGDGFHRSGSTALHREAVEWLVLPLALYRLNRARPPAELEELASLAIEAMLCVVSPSRWCPELGVTWANAFLGRHCGPVSHARRLLGACALATGRGELAYAAGEMSQEMVWWFGCDAPDLYRRLPEARPDQLSRNFVETGFAVGRDSWESSGTWCLLRGVPLAMAPEVAPAAPASLLAHDDFLSLTISIQGEPVLVEPGAPALPGSIGSAFSTISAHSAPRVCREREPLSPSTSERSQLPCHTVLDETAEGVILRASRPVWFMPDQPQTLVREVLIFSDQKRIAIRDRLDGSGEVQFESNLLLAPHLDVLMRGDMGCLLRGKKLQARILPLFPGRFRYELRRGSLSPFGGWVWSDAGKPKPAHRLRYFARLQAPLTLYLWVVWDPKDTKLPMPEDLDHLFAHGTRPRA